MKLPIAILLAASCLTAVGQVPDYVPTENLIAWWSLDGHALDAGGNAHDGILVGPNSATDRHDNPSGCLDFSDGDRIEVPTLLQHTPVLSVAFWLELDAYESDNHGGYNHFFNKWGNQNTSFICSANSNALYLYSGNNLFQSDDLPSLNEWHHIAFVINPPVASIYIDGQQVHSFDEIPDVPHMPSKFVQIGGNKEVATYNSVDGRMDDLGFWGRALSSAEIAGVYQSSFSLSGCTDETACNYSEFAVTENGSCDYSCCPGPGCCDVGTEWSWSSNTCIVANPSDSNFDGCVQLNDLLDLLSAYGDCATEESAWQCGDPLEYQGYDYETVQIGEQCWFAENARFLPWVDLPSSTSFDQPKYYVTGYFGTELEAALNHPSYVTNGALYNWPAVTSGDLCPAGWGVPTEWDWQQLELTLGMPQDDLTEVVPPASGVSRGSEQLVGAALKASSFGGVGSTGFNVRPSGYLRNGEFLNTTNWASFWTSTQNDGLNALDRFFSGDADGVWKSIDLYNDGFSVRCIKDTE